MLTCGTGLSAGHSLVAKQASAACDSGHTAKCLAPSSLSVQAYSPPPWLWSGSPRASTYNRRLAGGSAAITATLATNSIFTALSPTVGSRNIEPPLAMEEGRRCLHRHQSRAHAAAPAVRQP